MMPTAARLAASSAKRSFQHQSPTARVAGNLAGWGTLLGFFMGWPMIIQTYEYKVNGKPQ